MSPAPAVRVLADDSARPRASALRTGLPPNSLSAGGASSSNTATSSSSSSRELLRGEWEYALFQSVSDESSVVTAGVLGDTVGAPSDDATDAFFVTPRGESERMGMVMC